MYGIDIAFWIGMGLVGAVVIIGCAAAWLMPPKVNEERKEDRDGWEDTVIELPQGDYSTGH